MNNDTKYGGIMGNDTKYSGIISGDIKSASVFLATEALDFLMTEDNDYLVLSRSGVMTNDIKL